jgi:hypothetical protein
VKDLTKDSSFNTLDYQPVGCLDPRFYGGVQNTLQYKGFQLDFFLQFISQTGLNYLGNAGFPAGLIYNMPTDILSRWQKPGDLASVQKFTQATNSPAYKSYSSLLLRSNGIYSDASFIRLKNASIAYSFPDKGIKKAGIASLKVYLTGQNLFTLTSYKGGDPETQNFLRMPPLRTLVGGIQLTF